MKRLLATVFALVGVASASAQIILQDSFDSYADQAAYDAVWTPTAGTHINGTLSTAQAVSAPNSVRTLTNTAGTQGSYRNLGGDYDGTDAQPLVVSFWQYYITGGTRHYNEVRGYTGAGFNDGSLVQLYAAGWNNSVTAPGEVFAGNKFQGRVAFGAGSGWVNLNGAGSPNRTDGWHKFTIEIRTNDVNFYVDDILSRNFIRGTLSSFDTYVIGSRLTSAEIETYTDDVLVERVPEPTTLALLGLAGVALLRRR